MTQLPLWLSFRALSEELDFFLLQLKSRKLTLPFSLSSGNNTVAGELAEGETHSQSCESIILCYIVSLTLISSLCQPYFWSQFLSSLLLVNVAFLLHVLGAVVIFMLLMAH